MAAKHRITVNLTRDEYEALLALSNQNQVSMAWLGRRAITEMIDRYAESDAQLPLGAPKDGKRTK